MAIDPRRTAARTSLTDAPQAFTVGKPLQQNRHVTHHLGIATMRLLPRYALAFVLILVFTGVARAAQNWQLVDAAKKGYLDTVNAHLSVGADPNATDGEGFTALHWAAYRGHDQIVATLLNAGADPNARNEDRNSKHYGRTPLRSAVGGGQTGAVSALLNAGADPDATDNAGFSVLHWAAYRGHDEIVAALLSAGADPQRQKREPGQQVLRQDASALRRRGRTSQRRHRSPGRRRRPRRDGQQGADRPALGRPRWPRRRHRSASPRRRRPRREGRFRTYPAGPCCCVRAWASPGNSRERPAKLESTIAGCRQRGGRRSGAVPDAASFPSRRPLR